MVYGVMVYFIHVSKEIVYKAREKSADKHVFEFYVIVIIFPGAMDT